MRRSGGFTLIELLVALTLFAVVGGTLLQLFHTGLRSARIAAEHTHAAYLARSKLTELQTYTDLQAGSLSGSFDDSYQWHATLSSDQTASTLDSIGRLQPLELKLTISWGHDEERRTLTLHSLLLTRRTET